MNKILKIIIILILAAVIALFVFKYINKEGYGNSTYAKIILAQEEGCVADNIKKIGESTYMCSHGEGSENNLEIVIKSSIKGDFDKDGTKESFVIWSENFSGSGTFVYQGIIDSSNTIKSLEFLGDRVIINKDSVKFMDDLISVMLTVHGPDDPQCCPTLEVTNTFTWDGENLIYSF